MDVTYKRLQNKILSFKMVTVINKKGTPNYDLESKPHPITLQSLSTCQLTLFFKYIIICNFTRTSKQQFPFMLEAKGGYLSTPPMLYSCMDNSPLHHTKSLAKVVPWYEVTGFHITAPFIEWHENPKCTSVKCTIMKRTEQKIIGMLTLDCHSNS